MDLVLFGDVEDDEQIAPHTDVHRLDDVQGRSGSNRGINGISPLPQNLEPRFGGQRLAGRDDAVAGHDLGTPCASQPCARSPWTTARLQAGGFAAPESQVEHRQRGGGAGGRAGRRSQQAERRAPRIRRP